MSKIDITLRSGNRGFITGSSGSGKTFLALMLVMAMPHPWVILDTKQDPGISKWATENNIKIHYGLKPWRKIEDDIIIRPNPSDIANPDEIDKWLGDAFYCPYIPSIYIDEGYQVGASNRKMGVGVTGLWTRGRALGFCTLIGTQRPAWISSFVLTESDHYYCLKLTQKEDREKMAEFMGDEDIEEAIEKRWFWFSKQGDQAYLCEPLSLSNEREISIDSKIEMNHEVKRKLII